ncbi:hypothetical protein B296_00045935 [Ensete ventricosum]|uniref:Uncharacterized protein n=1 Tax=Ensete ventricosum TaxID=4639 RepID=A0A426YZ18_ENSVE|nr:hypothetical protein B296_00045935 [Ensete ventricosum]
MAHGSATARGRGRRSIISSPLIFSSFPLLFLPFFFLNRPPMVDFSRNRPPTVDFWLYRPVAGGPCTGNLEDRYVPHGSGAKFVKGK